MLSRCTNLDIARTAPPCASSSAKYRRASPGHRNIEKNFNACIEIFSCCFVDKNHKRYITDQRRAAHNRRRIIGEAHQGLKSPRHSGGTSAMFSTCWCKHRRCIFDVIISQMICVIHRRCYRTALQNIDNVMAMFSPVCFISSPPSNTTTEQKWSLLYPWSYSAVTRYAVPCKISPPFICSPQGTIPSPWRRKTSERHCRDITPLTHLGDHRPTIVDSKSTPLNVSRCSADYSSNHPRCIDENSAKCRWYFPEGLSHRVCVFSCDHTFDFGTDRHQSTYFSSPLHRQIFWPSWDRSITSHV